MIIIFILCLVCCLFLLTFLLTTAILFLIFVFPRSKKQLFPQMGITLLFNDPRCQMLKHFIASSNSYLAFLQGSLANSSSLAIETFPKKFVCCTSDLPFIQNCRVFFFLLVPSYVCISYSKPSLKDLYGFTKELAKEMCEGTNKCFLHSQQVFYSSSLVILLTTTRNMQCASCYNAVK